jgi:hypothetical protein
MVLLARPVGHGICLTEFLTAVMTKLPSPPSQGNEPGDGRQRGRTLVLVYVLSGVCAAIVPASCWTGSAARRVSGWAIPNLLPSIAVVVVAAR